jgi:hypothetical protein
LASRLLVISVMFRVVLLLASLASCFEEPTDVGPQVTSVVARRDFPLAGQARLDLLFVVDSSPAMAPHRATLLANAQRFVDVLAAIPFGFPDLHVGVITADADGDAGALIVPPGAQDRFLTDSRRGDGIREINYAGELSGVLGDTFDVAGTSGSSFSRPFEAVLRALTNPANTGFVREDGGLVIMFLTANDDCSFKDPAFVDDADAFSCIENPDALLDVAQVADQMKALKRDPAQVMMLGAFGPAEPFVADAQARTVAPACTSADQQRSAQPGVRMHALLQQFPNRSASVSVCEDDLSTAFEAIGQNIKTSFGAPCFDVPLLDVDPIAEGGQYECAAWMHEQRTGDERTLFECDAGEPGPCWKLEHDPVICPYNDGQVLRIDRYLPTRESVHAIIECVVQ